MQKYQKYATITGYFTIQPNKSFMNTKKLLIGFAALCLVATIIYIGSQSGNLLQGSLQKVNPLLVPRLAAPTAGTTPNDQTAAPKVSRLAPKVPPQLSENSIIPLPASQPITTSALNNTGTAVNDQMAAINTPERITPSLEKNVNPLPALQTLATSPQPVAQPVTPTSQPTATAAPDDTGTSTNEQPAPPNNAIPGFDPMEIKINVLEQKVQKLEANINCIHDNIGENASTMNINSLLKLFNERDYVNRLTALYNCT